MALGAAWPSVASLLCGIWSEASRQFAPSGTSHGGLWGRKEFWASRTEYERALRSRGVSWTGAPPESGPRGQAERSEGATTQKAGRHGGDRNGWVHDSDGQHFSAKPRPT